MISKIILHGFASYQNPVEINVSKRLNFFYGTAGVGKTALSYYLQDMDNDKFNRCSTELKNDLDVFVYNTEFIKKNFYDAGTINGIFTIGEENTRAEEAIAKATQYASDFHKKIDAIEMQKEAELEQEQNAQKSMENKLWKVKEKYENTDLDFCLTGCKDAKKKLYNRILETGPNLTIDKTVDELRKEAGILTRGNSTQKEKIRKIILNTDPIENDPIFQEAIIGTKDSPLSELIEELDNADWVKQGEPYLDQSKGKCPFCQQNMDSSLVEHIKGYFDNRYQSKLQRLYALKSSYEEIKEQVPDYESYNEPLVKEDGNFKQSLQNFRTQITDNLEKIETKINSPSKKISLVNTSLTIIKLNESLQEINQKIGEHNEKIQNRQQTENEIKSQFWQLMRNQYQSDIVEHKKTLSQIKQRIKGFNEDIHSCSRNIQEQKTIISENQKLITNIETSISNINLKILELGLVGFEIEKHGGNSYRIKRNNPSGEDNEFWTLSEGEKNLISFLYFIEKCRGTDDSNNQVDLTNRVIVIDDPVSSLSHTYVFDIAQLIKRHFFEESYKQIFVLTHSLYFLSEAIKTEDEKKLFRVYKDSYSCISEMRKDEIQNDYQAYWQVIKDFSAERAGVSGVVLANSMRNILEYFFGFIRADKNFRQTKQKLEKDYPAFTRYMNRESHSDAVNAPFDIKEIDPSHFMEAFSKVFKEADFENHYETMMGISET